MYQVSAELQAAILSSSPLYGIMLEDLTAARTLTAEAIFSANSDRESTSLSDDIELGAVCSQSWTVNIADSAGGYVGHMFRLSLYIADVADIEGGKMTWGRLARYKFGRVKTLTPRQIRRLGEVLGEPIPMGVFICTKAPRNGTGRELSLYDMLYFADREYKCTLTLPASAEAVEQDVCRQLGIQCMGGAVSGDLQESGGADLLAANGAQLVAASFDFEISTIAAGTTCRQMLGYIAAARGHFGFIDRDGVYRTRWYTSAREITASEADEPTLSESPNIIVGVVCNIDDDTRLTVGETDESKGRILQLTCPYMTRSLLDSLFSRVKNYTWYTAQFRHRLGDPRLDVGDVVTYSGAAIPVTGLAFSYDGGLSADITAAGLNDEEQLI